MIWCSGIWVGNVLMLWWSLSCFLGQNAGLWTSEQALHTDSSSPVRGKPEGSGSVWRLFPQSAQVFGKIVFFDGWPTLQRTERFMCVSNVFLGFLPKAWGIFFSFHDENPLELLWKKFTNFVVFPKTGPSKAFNYPAGPICVSRKSSLTVYDFRSCWLQVFLLQGKPLFSIVTCLSLWEYCFAMWSQMSHGPKKRCFSAFQFGFFFLFWRWERSLWALYISDHNHPFNRCCSVFFPSEMILCSLTDSTSRAHVSGFKDFLLLPMHLVTLPYWDLCIWIYFLHDIKIPYHEYLFITL